MIDTKQKTRIQIMQTIKKVLFLVQIKLWGKYVRLINQKKKKNYQISKNKLILKQEKMRRKMKQIKINKINKKKDIFITLLSTNL